MGARRLAAILMSLATATSADELLVLHKRADSLGFYDPSTGRKLATVPVGRKPHEMALSADGRRLYVTVDRPPSLLVIDPERRTIVERHPVGQSLPHMVDRAGRFGYVSAQGEDKVVKFGLSGWKPVLDVRTDSRPDPLLLLEE